MLPYCALDIKHVAYISRQQKRWSDQWFMLPRSLAQTVLSVVHSDIKPYCVESKHTHRIDNSENTSHVRRKGSLMFEEMVFKAIERHARGAKIDVVPSLFPRVLTRLHHHSVVPGEALHERRDISNKCDRFMWYVPPSDCGDLVIGAHSKSFVDTIRDEKRKAEKNKKASTKKLPHVHRNASDTPVI